MRLFINGQWIGEELEQVKVINPANQEIIDSVPSGTEKEAKAAVDAAYDAFQTWSIMTAEMRSQYLMKWFELIEENEEDLATTLTLEQGKPLAEARGEIRYANSFIRWYAEEGKRLYGETIPASSPNKKILVQKQPVGVVSVITPWNFPAAMITRKVAPALAVGCTVVIKPAPQTPLTALKLAELAEKANIPKGVINVVTGSAQVISGVWQKDARVRKLTFTGSTQVGKLLMKEAAETMKKVSFELGGHAPFIVTKHANLDVACEQLMVSKFRNAGQTCVCANRVYVEESVAARFIEKVQKAMEKLKVGNGLGEGVTIGPLIDEAAVEKVLAQIQDAQDKGANVLVGGERLTGLFVLPTLLTDVSDEMLCMNEETFGPVLPITMFKTEEEVIKRANDTPYGLAAYLFSDNIGEAIRLSEKLEYGIIGINDGAISTAQAPFGGMKQSGIGREGGHYGIDEFVEVKYISLQF